MSDTITRDLADIQADVASAESKLHFAAQALDTADAWGELATDGEAYVMRALNLLRKAQASVATAIRELEAER